MSRDDLRHDFRCLHIVTVHLSSIFVSHNSLIHIQILEPEEISKKLGISKLNSFQDSIIFMRNAISSADSLVCKNRFSSTMSVVKLSKTGRVGS